MSRIHILAVIGCAASALMPAGAHGDERPDAAPIKIAPRLFNNKDEATLGLATVKGEHQVLYRATEDGYKFCHQQNLAVWQGKLFLMWSNGITHEDHNGQRILCCYTKDGVKWSQPAVLTKDHDGPGPLACVSAGWHAAGDTLVAYYTAIVEKRPGIDERNALFYLTSKDGQTWSKPTKLAQGFFIEGPRRLPGGRLMMNGQWADRQPRLRFTDASDGVSGWKDGKIPRVENVFTFPEPSWFVRADGTIVMIFRTKSGDPWIYASLSNDNGESWSKPAKTNFPDATARAFAGNLPDGTAFIIGNPSRVPSKTYPSIGRRNPLTIALSKDGVLFDRAFAIRSEDTSMRFKGINKLDGWQYPTAVVWKDHLYVAYSINKEDEGVTRIALRDLPAVAHDHRIDVKIDKRGTIVPPGTLTRAMMSMVRHPDGAIFLNTQSGSLYKSTNNGESWTPVSVKLVNVPPKQTLHGLGVNRKGRLLLVHQTPGHDPKDKRLYGQDLFVSYSDDGGRTWTTSQTDFRKFPPGIPNMKFHEDGNRTFIEQTDGTLMFTTTIVAAENYGAKHPPKSPPQPPNYEYGGKPQDLFGDIIFRSTDGGKTWGDPTRVYTDLNPHESALAIDPKNPKHILEFARIQRLVRPEEDAEEMMRKTGNPKPYYKQAALFESTDGGRKFRLAHGGMTDWYGHRGSIVWTKRNVVVLTHNAGQNDSRVLARISLDGGRTWVNGNEQGTPLMTKSTKFVLAPSHSFTTPTVELADNHFLTVYCIGDFAVKGVFWHLE